ncbi:hypothetical protein CR513_13353, partial [Mucuna pruriens]
MGRISTKHSNVQVDLQLYTILASSFELSITSMALPKGTFVLHGRENILIIIIGRPKHLGHVQTARRCVGLRQYFGTHSRHTPTPTVLIKEQLEEMTQQIYEHITMKVYKLGSIIHHQTLHESHIRVVVEQIQDADVQVLVPIDETLNTFIAWSKSLLKLVSATIFIKENGKVGGNPIQIELDAKITSKNSTLLLYLCEKDILEICTRGKMLCISTIQL